MKLYFHPFSSNARRAVITQKLLGVAAELVFVDLAKGAQRAPEFLALNPNHAVPVLVDDDFVLTESHAIMIYLAEGTPGQSLYPADRRARAQVNRWMFWCSNHWSPAISGLNFEHSLKKMFGQGDADPAQVARHERLFHQFAAVLDAQLATRAWVTGESLTLADISLATPLMYAAPAKLPLEGYPHITAWMKRVEALPAWQETSAG